MSISIPPSCKTKNWPTYSKPVKAPLVCRVKKNFDEAMRRARLLRAAPPWLSDEDKAAILAIYQETDVLERLTGVPHEVDLIVQLVGKNKAGYQVSSGIHVPWNLRGIACKMNRIRGD
ncbi:hypothetical protein JMK10_16310 [Rhodovulum sulfidophilum]|uniref:hypothetical protein n=1 Tax=Rhodovulum sulfidophilum TaxID=35806 RepID=UPI00192262DD|nr:hypothetical protein [Rhodovulum sulfidophilum]MBL3575736.1 hypothetical protein [Rhodovulum sulfidophilum]MCE8432261.1 hypothetical protein [Rhodovulum sulfidophilum]MCF4118328.1 hypothetical protein [Rhodovulum sulfidophilum]